MAWGNKSSASLAPGFRFHPTDEELIRYYLKRKLTNKPFCFEPIAVVDIYKSEPWDLPDRSKLKSRDLEWYFFSMLDKKYGNGSKTNRATEKGYWKTTGKDRSVRWNSRDVGMKKTLVYHLGRAPRGERTNWVMHEYGLTDEDLEKAGIVQDAFVLCRIFQKTGTGPKNGDQYGAPFVEEEWDDDEMVTLLPGEEMAVTDELVLAHDAYVESDDLDQNYDVGVASENTALPVNFSHGETRNYAEHSGNYSGGDDHNPIIDRGKIQYVSDLPNDQNLFIFPQQYEIDAKSVRHEHIAESSNKEDAVDNGYQLEEPFMDASNDPLFTEGLFLETSDLSNRSEPDSAGHSTVFDMVDECLNFFDANDDNLSFDPSELMGSETNVSQQVSVPEKDVNGGNEEVPIATDKLVEAHSDSDAFSSKQHKPEVAKFESDMKKYPFVKAASHMLGGISAPPAFASEFPIKGSALQLNAAQASSSIRVTAGMIRIENITFGGNGFGKNGNVNIVFSFALREENATRTNVLPDKIWYVASWGWFLFSFFWVLILSVGCKIGTCICASKLRSVTRTFEYCCLGFVLAGNPVIG